MSILAKGTRRTVSIDNLIVDVNLNIRERDNYDLPSMKQQILEMGRIVKPILVKEEEVESADGKKLKKLIVLSGNRRTWAGQELYSDGTTPAEVKEALSKVDVIVYTNLSANDEIQLIIDHGQEKAISRTEVVNSCWRLDKLFFSEAQIISKMFQALASYSGNTKKLLSVPAEPKARVKYLHTWFHSTVGNYILAAAKMGDYLRQQFILTHRAEDKLLKEDEAVELRCSRVRITELSAAITADRDTDKGGKGWNPETGGETFNALIEKFKAEDRGEADADPKANRLSVKDLKEYADKFKSPAVRATFMVAAGDTEHAARLNQLDDDWQTTSMKMEVLRKHVDKVSDPKVKAFVDSLLSGVAGGVEEAIKPLLSV